MTRERRSTLFADSIVNRLIFILIGVLLVAPAACAGAPGADRAGDVEMRHLRVDGLQREYLLYLPKNAGKFTGPRPLIMVFHGGGGTAGFAWRETGPTLARIADDNGVYLVFPNAVNKMWDFGAGKISETLEPRVDDAKFFETILDRTNTEFDIDQKKIFATGISRGGQASYFIACRFPGRIRAIAPVAMPIPKFMTEICADAPPVGVAMILGTDDPIVPYGGGEIEVFNQQRGEVLSAADSAAFWRDRNDCLADAQATKKIDTADDGMRVVKTEWRKCEGAPVTLFKIVGGGHTWPSGKQYLPSSIVGPVNHDIDAGVEAWRFFSEFK